jgi:hypothetical protein
MGQKLVIIKRSGTKIEEATLRRIDQSLVATGVPHKKERDVSSLHLFLPEHKGATAAAAKTKKRVLNIIFAW